VSPAVAVADLASISGGIRASLTPAAEYFNTLGVPDWLVRVLLGIVRGSYATLVLWVTECVRVSPIIKHE
jgi:hypothetical protein